MRELSTQEVGLVSSGGREYSIGAFAGSSIGDAPGGAVGRAFIGSLADVGISIKRVLAYIFALAIGCAFSNAHAQVTAYPCNGCTLAQATAVAQTNANAAKLAGPLVFQYVYDLTGNNFWKFNISSEPISGSYAYYVNQVTPTTQESSAFSVLYQVTRAAGPGLPVLVNTNSSYPGFPYPQGSAFTITPDNGQTYNAGTWITQISNNLTIQNTVQSLASLINALSAIILKDNTLTVDIMITFTDGSTMEFIWQPGQRVAVLVESRDINGNLIPLPSSTVPVQPGNYSFSKGGGDKFANYLNTWWSGIVTGTSCTNSIMACTNSGAGLHCQWVPNCL
jgi:hypothetical protein